MLYAAIALTVLVLLLTPFRLKPAALVLLLGGWVIAAAWTTRRRPPPTPDADTPMTVGPDGELVPDTEAAPPPAADPIRLSGSGPHATEPLHLKAGVYRVRYRFPAQGCVRVVCVDVATGDRNTWLEKSHDGSLIVTVPTGGRYAFEIAPDSPAAAWSFDVQPLR